MSKHAHRKTEAPPPDGAEHPAPAAEPSAAPEAAPAEAAAAESAAALQDRLLRLQADFENLRKRTEREQAEVRERAAEKLLTDLLPVLDHFDLGLGDAGRHGAPPALVEGFRLIRDQLAGVLAGAGLTPVEAEGQPFDPHAHEAVTCLPSEEHPADTVVAETRRGYRLGRRLLRAAQVIVSSGPPPATAGSDG